jgi:hypothetical protein
MLKVTIELWPRGDRARAQVIHEAIIYNSGGTRERGEYVAHFSRRGGFSAASQLHRGHVTSAWRSSEVWDFPRLMKNAWHLLALALDAALEKEGDNR